MYSYNYISALSFTAHKPSKFWFVWWVFFFKLFGQSDILAAGKMPLLSEDNS